MALKTWEAHSLRHEYYSFSWLPYTTTALQITVNCQLPPPSPSLDSSVSSAVWSAVESYVADGVTLLTAVTSYYPTGFLAPLSNQMIGSIMWLLGTRSFFDFPPRILRVCLSSSSCLRLTIGNRFLRKGHSHLTWKFSSPLPTVLPPIRK